MINWNTFFDTDDSDCTSAIDTTEGTGPENSFWYATSTESRNTYQYRVTDSSVIVSCSLLTNGTLTQGGGYNIFPNPQVLTTDQEVARDIPQDIIGDTEFGHHNWTVQCTDTSGNTGNSGHGWRYITTAVLDSDDPWVEYYLPLNGSTFNFNQIKFIYLANDSTSSIGQCELLVVGNLDTGEHLESKVIDTVVPESVAQTAYLSFDKGNYYSTVTCLDTSAYQNEGVSQNLCNESYSPGACALPNEQRPLPSIYSIHNRTFRVNTQLSEFLIDSCADVCVVEGYSGVPPGVCENSPPKCNDIDPNGIHWPPGDQYCTGGAESDTCCCKNI